MITAGLLAMTFPVVGQADINCDEYLAAYENLRVARTNFNEVRRGFFEIQKRISDEIHEAWKSGSPKAAELESTQNARVAAARIELEQSEEYQSAIEAYFEAEEQVANKFHIERVLCSS